MQLRQYRQIECNKFADFKACLMTLSCPISPYRGRSRRLATGHRCRWGVPLQKRSGKQCRRRWRYERAHQLEGETPTDERKKLLK